MPVIQPDLTEMVDLSPLDPGTYHATIVEAPTKKSKGGENKKSIWMVVPKFEVKVDGREKPATRTTYLPVEGAGTYGFDQLLRACHFDDLADQYKDPGQPNPDFDTDKLVGQQLMVVVEQEYYQPTDAAGNPQGAARLQDKIRTFLKA